LWKVSFKTVISHCVGYTTISAISQVVTNLYYSEVTCSLNLHHFHFWVVGWFSDKNYPF